MLNIVKVENLLHMWIALLQFHIQSNETRALGVRTLNNGGFYGETYGIDFDHCEDDLNALAIYLGYGSLQTKMKNLRRTYLTPNMDQMEDAFTALNNRSAMMAARNRVVITEKFLQKPPCLDLIQFQRDDNRCFNTLVQFRVVDTYKRFLFDLVMIHDLIKEAEENSSLECSKLKVFIPTTWLSGYFIGSVINLHEELGQDPLLSEVVESRWASIIGNDRYSEASYEEDIKMAWVKRALRAYWKQRNSTVLFPESVKNALFT